MTYIVDIDGTGFVFSSVTDAAAFMYEAAHHIKRGRYRSSIGDITMRIGDSDTLHELFPYDYPVEKEAAPEAEEVTDETTT